MTVSPIVTIVTTAKDAAAFLPETIASVKAQTFRDWQWLIFDDASCDDTKMIVERASADDRRMVLCGSNNLGRARALNFALRNAAGEWLMILDADDIFHPQKLEIHLDCAAKLGVACVSGTEGIVVFDRGRPCWPSLPSQTLVTNVTRRLPYHNPLMHSSVCLNRKVFERLPGYNVQLAGALDYRLYLDAVLAGATLNQIHVKLVAKRIHQGQKFERRRRLRYLAAGLRVQVAAIKETHAGPLAFAGAFARFGYGLLPRALRLRRYT